MQWLAEICVRRPVFASVLILILLVCGAFGYGSLGVDRFPKIDFPIVVIITTLPGSAPEEIEADVTDPIEEAVNTVSGIEELRSVSAESVSQVFVQFALEKDIDVAVAEVRDKLALITKTLPKGIDLPVVTRIDPDAQPVMTLSVASDAPLRDITEFTDRILRRKLENINGVGQVTLLGGRKRQINVTLDGARLRAFSLTALDVQRTLLSQNIQFPGGTVDQGTTQFTLRTQGRVTSVAEIGQLVITNKGTNLVRIADVATVIDGEIEPDTQAILNGRSAVVLQIRKQSGTNTVQVVDKVIEKVNDMQKSLPPGYAIKVVSEQAKFVRAAIRSVEEHLILGSFLAALVVLIFLGNWRSTLIAAIAIPTSIISTFAFMKVMGFTLNVLTLLALTLSVGIVIDDAIVVLENIVSFIEKKRMKPYDAAIDATREIGLAVMATTMSLAIIFIPVSFMAGIVGRFMHSFGLTMAFAIVVSLVVSFTLTPMLSARWLKPLKEEDTRPGTEHSPTTPAAPGHPPMGGHKKNIIFDPIERAYTAFLRWCLIHWWAVLVAGILTVLSLGPTFKAVNKNFLPLDDESQFGVFIRAPEGTTLRQTSSIAQKASRAISAYAEVSDVLVTQGDDAGKTPNVATLYVKLVDTHERTRDQDQVMVDIREHVLPGLTKEFNLRTSVGRFGIVGGGNQNAALQYRISGPDLHQLGEVADRVAAQVKAIPGTVDVDTSMVLGKPELRVKLDRNKAGDLGVNMVDVASTLQLMVGGLQVSRYEENTEQYDIFVRGSPEFRSTDDGLLQLPVPSRKAGTVRVADVASLERASGPSVINRLARKRQVTITANVLPGTSLQAIMEQVTERVAKLNLDPSYSGDFVGQSKEQGKAGKAFAMAFLLSLIFMYLVLAAQFESWLHPITILLALPLTLPFAILSIVLLNGSLNIFSALGMLVLFGVVKKNGILQIDHANQLKAAGMSTFDAVLYASRDRLRPILMTTVAFVAGMIPLAVSTGTGSATNKATSSVIIGGQIMSLVLTLVATPVAYLFFDWLQRASGRAWAALRGKPRPDAVG